MPHGKAAWRSHSKWMFDISPACQANLALWHAITGLITAVCGLEGTQAGLALLTGPDRLIRSTGTQNGNSQTPHISLLAWNSLQVQKALSANTCSLTPCFRFSVVTLVVPTIVTSYLWAGSGLLWYFCQSRCSKPFAILTWHHALSNLSFFYIILHTHTLVQITRADMEEIFFF